MRFNPDDMDYVVNPYPMYRYLREHQPVHFWEGNGWVISRHRDVERLLADPRLSRFPSRPPRAPRQR